LVIGATGAITFDTPSPLPSGRVDQPYSQQIAISGATGTATFSITSGALPAGLNMNAQGLITGTPTTQQQSTFTVRVIDSNPDTATATFDLTVNPKPIGGSSSSSGSSGGCSSHPSGAGWLLVLLAVAASGLILRVRRRRA
jgi:large repetitive protein